MSLQHSRVVGEWQDVFGGLFLFLLIVVRGRCSAGRALLLVRLLIRCACAMIRKILMIKVFVFFITMGRFNELHVIENEPNATYQTHFQVSCVRFILS